jgi:hypothetical protein
MIQRAMSAIGTVVASISVESEVAMSPPASTFTA